MEAHCIALELKYQNQALKLGHHGQILNETSNKAKIKKEIDVLETMNIELEYTVAKLRKENETFKKYYKDLHDSFKITRSKTIEQRTSLLANNADLKAHIQEKVFAIVALKNDLRKLKGNSVDTKFAKTTVLGKPVLQSLRNQSVVRQLNGNSSKNMPRFSSNDMVHNHYLDEARKKTQERDRNSKTSVMPSTSFQSTVDDSKVKPRNNNQTPRSLHVSKSSCVTITAVPKADHSKSSSSFSDSKHFKMKSRAKIQSHKTINSNKPVDQKSHTQKPGRQIFTRHRFSPNKTSAVYEKTSPRYDLSKDYSESTHGSNVDIPNIHKCKQTLDLSEGTSINVHKEQGFDLSADASDKLHNNQIQYHLLQL
ncbi:hypothetical protein Tco_1015639 [Tanacetum coccineum]|uniref:Uncharacterized protein n=1 Tax=Tanacetum coccineum TaxID=301880 RepID=A0ABQ5FMG0_9ASTR